MKQPDTRSQNPDLPWKDSPEKRHQPMPAYSRLSVAELVKADSTTLIGQLQVCYASDGYQAMLSQQTRAWDRIIPQLQQALVQLLQTHPATASWTVLIEYPLYRLRKRIDLILLTAEVGVVLETKVGETHFQSADLRQVEDYALDLHDFHAESHSLPLLPVLWCTEAEPVCEHFTQIAAGVDRVRRVGKEELATLLGEIASRESGHPINGEKWDNAAYRPVPGIIEAATCIFAKHDVEEIARKEADNLDKAAKRIIDLIVTARDTKEHALIFLTGVPGSGKTLAGLRVVHDAITTGKEQEGDIVYLSGNSPLVAVLREALARDEYRRNKKTRGATLEAARGQVRTRVQHINDFLQGYVNKTSDPPHEHAIVFDEAQRAWDATQGKKKFDREASEPALLLELMSRHQSWCACVCLVGGGQEINSGEEGVAGWGEALRNTPIGSRWSVHAPPDVVEGGLSAGGRKLGLPSDLVKIDDDLQLRTPMRSYRSSKVSKWVDHVIEGQETSAAQLAGELTRYPIHITRSLEEARRWLRHVCRGQRRCGLVASSGARRLRAEGLGVSLHAADRTEIEHWYLQPPGDIRASHALEVTANEYTCQGLELDFVGVCWGGDYIRSANNTDWLSRKLGGTRWSNVQNENSLRFLKNTYRVLLTRAREGMILFIPSGDPADPTRDPTLLNATADFLTRCGARTLTARSGPS